MSPRELQVARVHASLARLRQLLDDLDAFVGEPSADDLGEDRARRYIAERILTQLVEVAVSVNSHVAAAVLGRAPVDHRASFDLAAEAGLLPAPLAADLRDATGLRNVLVHQYLDVDLQVVAEAVPRARGGLGDHLQVHVEVLVDQDVAQPRRVAQVSRQRRLRRLRPAGRALPRRPPVKARGVPAPGRTARASRVSATRTPPPGDGGDLVGGPGEGVFASIETGPGEEGERLDEDVVLLGTRRLLFEDCADRGPHAVPPPAGQLQVSTASTMRGVYGAYHPRLRPCKGEAGAPRRGSPLPAGSGAAGAAV
jgi:uncharacterized protein YutE (UPF0331/DUF86 family)